jgi:hypothetical protein
MSNLKLLIKFPTRERPDKFFKVLDLYYHLLCDSNFEFIISCDIDDITMNNPEIISKLEQYDNLTVCFSDNNSKVEAINADMKDRNFDILLLASDDMVPEVNGYDVIIKQSFQKYFNNLDGVLWLNDGFQGSNLNTLVIIGSEYYNRFNYIYNPEYKSLYCDTEFTIVSNALDKAVYLDRCLIRHQQYSIINDAPDQLYIRNDELQHVDLITFNRRKEKNFDL